MEDSYYDGFFVWEYDVHDDASESDEVGAEGASKRAEGASTQN
jgi:hypothetical protein